MDDALRSVAAVLASTPSRWEVLAERIPPTLLARNPAPGEWSAIQCLQHILDTEHRVFTLRVSMILEGKAFPGFDPDREAGRPADDGQPVSMAQELRTRRQASLEQLRRLRAEDLPRKAIHPELGEVTLGELLHEWAAHDLMHTVQAERAIMQPFIDGCGPWRPSFADHIAK